MFFGGSLEAIVDRSVRISNSGVDGQVALVVRNRGIGAGIEEHSDAFSVRACRGYGERGNADVVTAVDGAALVLECVHSRTAIGVWQFASIVPVVVSAKRGAVRKLVSE